MAGQPSGAQVSDQELEEGELPEQAADDAPSVPKLPQDGAQVRATAPAPADRQGPALPEGCLEGQAVAKRAELGFVFVRAGAC